MKKALASFIHNLHRIKTIPDQKGNYRFLEIKLKKVKEGNLNKTSIKLKEGNFNFLQLLLTTS